jgi:TetR/AcrR family fatty acid metabolism transcriptional regulator
VEETDEPAADQLRHVALIILRTWRHEPDVVRVVVREIARTPEIQQQIGELVEPVDTIRRIVERGQATGELRADLDPEFAASVFYGGIDAILTGWVLGTRPDDPESMAKAERMVSEVLVGAFVAPPVGGA